MLGKIGGRAGWLDWARSYPARSLPQDLLAGIVVTMVLVPQAMAYAVLAGLPPHYGFYASIAPPVVYALLGTSMTLSVGPTAIIALMVGSALRAAGDLGIEYPAAAGLLALLTGTILLLMFALRLGNVVKFVSQPVLTGFMAGAAILIMLSQLPALLGTGPLAASWSWLRQVELPSLLLAGASIALLWFVSGPIRQRLLAQERVLLANTLGRSGPFLLMTLVVAAAWLLRLPDKQVFDMVGPVPVIALHWAALPIDGAVVERLLPSAAVIAIVVYLESISIAKALAMKRRQRVVPNRELLALGGANLAAALAGGFPVAGSFGRSSVNFAVGAQTPLASIATAGCLLACGLSLGPLFVYLPEPILAAIIIVSVAGLLHPAEMWRVWRYDRGNGVSLLICLFGVLTLGAEQGILLGVAFSIALLLARSSEPHVAIVGRVPNSEHFRNIERHAVETLPHVLAIRIDENLYFANAQFLEDYVMGAIADRPGLKHLVLICSGVNYIDASALDSLRRLIDSLRINGIRLHLAEVKGPVMDRLERSDLREHMRDGRIFLSTHIAMRELAG